MTKEDPNPTLPSTSSPSTSVPIADEPSSSIPLSTRDQKIKEAKELLGRGIRNYYVNAYAEAAEEFSRACEIYSELNGFNCDELGMPYLLYARALINIAQDENKDGMAELGQVEEEEEEDDDDDDDKDGAEEVKKQENGNANGTGKDEEHSKEDEPETKKSDEGETNETKKGDSEGDADADGGEDVEEEEGDKDVIMKKNKI